MKIPDTEYIHNLSYFLSHSNEDEADACFFLSQLSECCRLKQSDPLLWLDVGAGPGTKLIKILNGLHDCMGLLSTYSSICLDILEPSQSWQNILIQNFKETQLEHIIRNKYCLTWEGFESTSRYDIVTFFHSIYGINAESLSKIPGFLKDDGCACIVVESPHSDLHRIKQSLFPYIHHDELVSSSKTIVSLLDQEKMKYFISGDKIEQRFYVDDLFSPNNSRRLMPLSFILQTKPEDHNMLVSQEANEIINKALRKFVKKEEITGRYFLNVPDRFIWIYR